MPQRRSDYGRSDYHDLDGALARAAEQVEIARQEHLLLQQEHERLRLRQNLARQSERERQREFTSAGIQQGATSVRRANVPLPQQQQQQPPTSDRQGKDHPVFLLNCRRCGAFLSDRGMKAILLLKPHVTLFSTDVMPANVGPLYASFRSSEPESLTRDPSSSSLPMEPQPERTCDCLTETLGCYGCGTQIGYHIISPCSRCTASIRDDKRGSNGHRTVLHCSEITARERRYFPGEAGVRCAPTPCPYNLNGKNGSRKAATTSFGFGSREQTSYMPSNRQYYRTQARPNLNPRHRNVESSRPRQVRMVQIDQRGPYYLHPHEAQRGRGEEESEEDADFLHLDFELEDEESEDDEEDEDDEGEEEEVEMEQDKFEGTSSPSTNFSANTNPLVHAQQGVGRNRAFSTSASLNRAQNIPSSQAQQRTQLLPRVSVKTTRSGYAEEDDDGPPPRLIRRGEIVYWGDLKSGGERCRPFDSEMALQMPVALR